MEDTERRDYRILEPERPNDPCTSRWTRYKRTYVFLTVVSYDLYIDITLDPIKDRLTWYSEG
jgi:hypothetical protein